MSRAQRAAPVWALAILAGGCRFGFDLQEGPEPPPPPGRPVLGPVLQLTDAAVDSNNPSIACAIDRCLVVRHLGPSGDRRAYAVVVDPEGFPIGADVNVSENPSGHSDDAAIAWGGGVFGIAWAVDGVISFRTLDRDGAPASPVVTLSAAGELYEDPAVAFVGERFLVMFDRISDQSSRGMLIGIDGIPAEAERTIVAGRNPSLSFDGSQLFLAVSQGSDLTLLPIDAAGNVSGPPVGLGRGSKPRLSAVPGSQAVAFLDVRNRQTDMFFRIDDGAGLRELQLSSDPEREIEPAIASSVGDRLVTWDGDEAKAAFTFGALVTTVPTTTVSVFPLSEGPHATSAHPAVAWIDDHYLVAWEEMIGTRDQIVTRTVTPASPR